MSKRRIMVQAPNGMQVWIPEDRLEAWKKADHSAPLSEEEKKTLAQWKEKIYGNRK